MRANGMRPLRTRTVVDPRANFVAPLAERAQ